MALTPEQIDLIANEYLVGVFQEMEQDVISDIARRVRKTGRLTETAELMAQAMANQGYSPADIRIQVMQTLNADPKLQAEIAKNTLEYKKVVADRIDQLVESAKLAGNHMVANAGMMCFNDDLSLWSEANKELSNTALPQIVSAIQKQTQGAMQNLTQTTALALRDASGVPINIMDGYKRFLDKTTLEVATGTFSFDEAVNRTIKEMAKSGVRQVVYNNGRTITTELDVATRRAVRTGLSQMAGKIMEENVKNSDTDLVITSQHMGSRPEHAEWQNKVFSLTGKTKGYKTLAEGTGYGTVTGLMGANCGHSFYPYWPGFSIKEEPLKEPPPTIVNGREYTYYQATQKQREYERKLRAAKREIAIQEQSGGNPEDIKRLKREAQALNKEYNSFSNKVGIRPKPNRARVVGGGSGPTPPKVFGNRPVGPIDPTDRSAMPKIPRETAPEPNIRVTAQEASDDWFEYEKANLMSEYIRTGRMPTEDMYGSTITREEATKLKKEAELIQEIGEKTNTKYNTLYRGMYADIDDIRSLTPGDTYTFNTLSATSPVKDIAMIYTNENDFVENGAPVILEIQKSGGINGFKRDDAEVVLPRGASFKITRNYMDEDGVIHISLYASKKK